MKSFLSIALLGALAFAGTPEEDDAAAKKAVVSTRNEGATVGTYTHMISGTAWAMKDATNDAGTITVSTSWNRTGGTDSQDIFGLHMKFAPSATYTPGTAQIEYVMAKDAFTKPMQLVRFSSAIGTLTLHTYNWADIPMSVPEFVTAKGLLSAAS